MRTSLVVGGWDGDMDRLGRGALPTDGAEAKYVVRWFPPNLVRGTRTNPKTGKYESGEWDEPQGVSTRHGRYHPKRGGWLPWIKRMSEERIAELDQLDKEIGSLEEQIKQLRTKQREALKAAFKESMPLTIQEVKEWTEAAKAKEPGTGGT